MPLKPLPEILTEAGRPGDELILPMAATVVDVPGAESGLPVVVTAVLERTAVVEPRRGADRVLVRQTHVRVDPDLVRWAPRRERERPRATVKRP